LLLNNAHKQKSGREKLAHVRAIFLQGKRFDYTKSQQ
jgi:hypothetical protein